MIGTRIICYLVLSVIMLLIPGGVAGIIMVWSWFAYELYCEAKLWDRHQRYLEEKREANRKKGYVYID